MVFTLFGLHATAAAVNYAFYAHLTKYFSNSAEHVFLYHNKWPSKRPTLTREAIQYETKRDFSKFFLVVFFNPYT